ncbi:hypothetical protein RB195_019195 [Necator americanus]|uniref:Reverse transcriptase domain-containing protein n=1 Tax=Necator americanus TaxID=51031 RepID=A0ABR1CFN3_NECAM
MYKVLERIILDRLIKHREERTHDEQAGFRPGRSTIDQVFIVRRVAEMWQRYSKPMLLAFLDFEAIFDSPHRSRLLNALRGNGVPGKFVRLLDDMTQRTIAAVRTPPRCTTPFEVVTGVRQGTVAGPFLFNFAIDDIMRKTVGQRHHAYTTRTPLDRSRVCCCMLEMLLYGGKQHETSKCCQPCIEASCSLMATSTL